MIRFQISRASYTAGSPVAGSFHVFTVPPFSR